ncbi:MAG: DUF3180 domain-containing protein [Microbacteriaceae bacterium]
MTRTHPSLLLLLAVLGAAAGWFLQLWQVATGHAALVPPWSFSAVLVLIGVAIVCYAVPVWRSTSRHPGSRHAGDRGTTVARGTGKRVDPFYATRVVLLAKASSLTGALVGGACAGVLAFLLTRSVIPGAQSVALAVIAVLGAAVLLVGGLVAEKMCTLPPDDGDDADGARASR